MTLTAQQQKAREIAAQVNAALGDDNAVTFGNDERFKVTFTSTGLLPVDIILSGGVPTGRFILATGDFSTLKTYIGLKTVANMQREGKVCAVIDTEHSFDEDWAVSTGVDTSSLIIDRPATGELAMDKAEALVYNGVDFILFDSIAATLPQAERNKRLHNENKQVAATASLMSIACRKLTAANEKTSFMWINQLRTNVGVTFGPTDTMNGGKAMGYYASYILNLKKVGKITRDRKRYTGEKWEPTKEQIGQKYKMTLQKSKLSAPFAEVWFDWDLENNCIDLVGFLIAQGIEMDLVKQKGNTWTFKYGRQRELKAVGRQKFKDAMASNKGVQAALESAIRQRYGLPDSGTAGLLPEEAPAKRLRRGAPPKKKLVLRK